MNMRTQLMRIIDRAGLEPWPNVFQNLRSTRETELAEEFPMHVVCAWIGNSQAVAAKHYLQVTEPHFEKATQTMHDSGDSQCPASSEGLVLSAFSHDDDPCHTCTNDHVAEAGIERTAKTSGKTHDCDLGDVKSDVIGADLRSIAAELRKRLSADELRRLVELLGAVASGVDNRQRE
jgi:hypothetical protein